MIPGEARGMWREIEARLRPYVARRIASPSDIDDVMQEVLVRVHRGASGLRDGESFGGWVYRVAAHAVADQLRARARHPLARTSETSEVSEVSAADATEVERLQRDLTQCIALFVAHLPSPYREAITLTDLHGVTQKEAAEMLGLSLSGMKSRVQRGRERLRVLFEECCEISLDARGRVRDCSPRSLEDVAGGCRGAAVIWASRRNG